MKFMMIIKGDKNSEAGVMPDEKVIVAMGKYNEELMKAGVLLSAEGLHATSQGALLHYSKGKTTVTDGPFSEAKEVIAGFWMIQVKSKAEAIEWARRIPFAACDDGSRDGTAEIELRQVFDCADFAPEQYPSDEARSVLASEADFRKRTGG